MGEGGREREKGREGRKKRNPGDPFLMVFAARVLFQKSDKEGRKEGGKAVVRSMDSLAPPAKKRGMNESPSLLLSLSPPRPCGRCCNVCFHSTFLANETIMDLSLSPSTSGRRPARRAEEQFL